MPFPAGEPDLAQLEQSLEYTFSNQALLLRALTHSSSANEQSPESPLDNERLEFLGDSILGWVVSEWLFRRFSDYDEGRLSLLKNNLVSASYLLPVAHRLELGRYLRLGRGEETGGGRSKQRILVNAVEAVLAAVYLDGGAEEARRVTLRLVAPSEEELEALAGAGPPHDYRAELDRMTRDLNLPKPDYVLVTEAGPGHAKTFKIEARVGRQYAWTGEASSKKVASHRAAAGICRMLRERE